MMLNQSNYCTLFHNKRAITVWLRAGVSVLSRCSTTRLRLRLLPLYPPSDNLHPSHSNNGMAHSLYTQGFEEKY